MSTPRLGAAAGSELGARAAANVARAGGNAVDACLASAVMGWVAEPFFGSLGGSGFVAVRAPSGEVEIFDGNNMMPYTQPSEPGQGLKRTYFAEYADGMYTGIGGGSVGVPGILAAVHAAWQRHGRIEWEALFADAIAAAREGLPLSKTGAYYLSATWEPLWAHYEEARALFGPSGQPLEEGTVLVQGELADSLTAIAKKGPDVFYSGALGREIVDIVGRDGGFMTIEDLRRYEAVVRDPLRTGAWGWSISTNPPPTVGGAVLVHMLALLHSAELQDPVARLSAIVEAQRSATGYRRDRYQDPTGIAAAFQEAIASLQGKPEARGRRDSIDSSEAAESYAKGRRSSSTTHSSAADSDGYVCSVTESNGYGAGLIAGGVLLNNTLGEEELNPLGVHSLGPGSRCHSNMTPTIAAGPLGPDGSPARTVGLGSPGADRIVGAIAQTLIRLAVDGNPLEEAVAAPRAHLDRRPEGETICYEPGLPGERLDFVHRPYDEIHMYFGAVQAASVDAEGRLEAVHDPRRSGASVLV